MQRFIPMPAPPAVLFQHDRITDALGFWCNASTFCRQAAQFRARGGRPLFTGEIASYVLEAEIPHLPEGSAR